MEAAGRRDGERTRKRCSCGLGSLKQIVLMAVLLMGSATAQLDLETPHCGKRFRIAMHLARPFIDVDPDQCVDQRCPPEAFGEDGGFTYTLLQDEILPILKRICRDAGKSEDVEFVWYLPPTGRNLASNAVKMVCNGKFKDIRSVTETSQNASCPANWLYNGPSDAGTCDYIGDPTCTSEGPDMVAGAVHVLRERLDLLDFSVPYLTVQQILVKPRTEEPPDFMNVFKCFAFDLWFALFVEIVVVWILIILIESHANEQISKDTWFSPFYDSWFWAFGSAMNAGGPGKSPVTVAGRIFMLGHYFLMTLIVASYTGAFGPFLSSQSENIVRDYDSLAYDGKAVVVRGPEWDSDVAEPPFLGKYLGGNSDPTTTRSTQFKLLQTTMRTDSSANFNIYTTQRMDTYWDGKLLEPRVDLDPCLVAGAAWGAYDMVKCRNALTSVYSPEATIFDAPSVFYELNRRRQSTGLCELVTIGPQFSPSGFGFGFVQTAPIATPFSRAIQELLQDGKIEQFRERYRIRRQDSLCSEESEDGAVSMTIAKLFGLIVFTLLGILISCGQGVSPADAAKQFCEALRVPANGELQARWKKQDMEREEAYQKRKAEEEEAAAIAAEEEAAEAAAAAAEADADAEAEAEAAAEATWEAAENGEEKPSSPGTVLRTGRPGPGLQRSFSAKRSEMSEGESEMERRLGSFRSGKTFGNVPVTPRKGTIPKEGLAERVQMMLPQADRLERLLKRLKLPEIPTRKRKDNATKLREQMHEMEEQVRQQAEGITRTLSDGVTRTLSSARSGNGIENASDGEQ